MTDQDAEALEAEAEVEAGDHLDPEDEDQSDAGDKEQRVPYARFAKVVAKLNDTTERLNQNLLKAQEQPQEKPAEKTYTAAELRSFVDAEKITQDEADDIRETQLTKRVIDGVTNAQDQNSQKTLVHNELAQYEQNVPALSDPASDEFHRVEEEFRHLFPLMGSPKPGTVEETGLKLAAVRSIFGPINALKAAAGAKQKKADAFGEGGGGAGEDEPSGKDKTPTMTPKQKAYYRKMIDQGIIKDWDAVKTELSYTRPEV